MRRFIVAGHKVPANGQFRLDDLPGSGGRVDTLCRCVVSAFMLSYEIRRDTEVYLVLMEGDGPKTVRFEGATIRYLNPDERSTASLIRNACLKKIPAGKEVVSSPGVFVSRKGFAELVEELSAKGKFVYLKEDGTDVRNYEFPENPIYVVGDTHDLSPEEEAVLKAKNPDRINVGPLSLHANHCITLVNNEMDRRGGI